MSKLLLDHHVSLARILEEILSENIKPKWNILDLDVFLTSNSNFDVNIIDELIESGRNGYEINQETLKNLSKDIHQVHQLLLVGNFNALSLKNYETSDDWYSQNDFVIEMVDSCSNWEVWVKDERMARRIKLLNKNH